VLVKDSLNLLPIELANRLFLKKHRLNRTNVVGSIVFRSFNFLVSVLDSTEGESSNFRSKWIFPELVFLIVKVIFRFLPSDDSFIEHFIVIMTLEIKYALWFNFTFDLISRGAWQVFMEFHNIINACNSFCSIHIIVITLRVSKLL